MRKLKLYIATSLDGKIARPDGAIDWLPNPSGEDYGYQELWNSIDTVLMGYKTYELCLSFGNWHYKDKTAYVFSRSANKDSIAAVQLITKNPADFVQQLKESEGRDIWLVGGGEIVSLLHNAGLIDEYIIAFVPLVLGDGIGLFPSVTKELPLKLQKQKAYDNGLVLLYYQKQIK